MECIPPSHGVLHLTILGNFANPWTTVLVSIPRPSLKCAKEMAYDDTTGLKPWTFSGDVGEDDIER